jgi:hypothetical protein
MTQLIQWPDGKSFAFTIFDDSDLSTVENVREVYSFLENCGLRTTKSVWPVAGRLDPSEWFGGTTCADLGYLEWILSLQAKGFEIGYHLGTFHSSTREETVRALERFGRVFSHYPITMANHFRCKENMYWGDARFTGVNRLLYNVLTKFSNASQFTGHVEGDKYFWGDLCRDKTKYVRNFVFSEINTLKACPFMPYFDPMRPYVNYWFASSDGGDIESFNKCLAEPNQNRLEEEGGACIMYAHLAKGYYRDGALDPKFKSLIARLSKRNGWFVPVSTLLNYLVEIKGHHEISRSQRARLERSWLWNRLRRSMI